MVTLSFFSVQLRVLIYHKASQNSWFLWLNEPKETQIRYKLAQHTLKGSLPCWFSPKNHAVKMQRRV